MLAHYSHVRLDTKRKALDALADGGWGGYVPSHVPKFGHADVTT